MSKEFLSPGIPQVVRDEERIKSPEPFAVINGDITCPKLIAKLRKQSTFPGPSVSDAIAMNDGQELFGEEFKRRSFWELTSLFPVHFLENTQCLQARDWTSIIFLNKLQGPKKMWCELP